MVLSSPKPTDTDTGGASWDTAPATRDEAISWQLTPEEWERIQRLLGRTPNRTELALFGVMWSEHCCYKNSLFWLRMLPRESPHLLAKPGEENAGLLRLPGGWACAFKIESHNHPSAIAPYQGAATGVGGIHRDIFTTGAFPIACLDAIHFGMPEDTHVRWLLDGVVRGIADYGNSFGVPTVGGQTFFAECFRETPIVNAMSVGIVEEDRVIQARVREAGFLVVIAGAPTGKDGLRGAAFASANLDPSAARENLPAVQIGDPFLEKILLEAILEAHREGLIRAMQDMGAAGIACSTLEISARSRLGMDVHLDRVPLRHSRMRPWEILLSESQERMLIICAEEDYAHLYRIFTRWGVPLTRIGRVTDQPRVRYFWRGKVIAEVPPQALMAGDGAPVYRRSWKEPEYRQEIRAFQETTVPVPAPAEWKQIAEFLTGHPNGASKRPIWSQYDHMIQLRHISPWNPTDASVVRIHPGSMQALALTTDANPHYVFADPYLGTWMAVAEAIRNILCTGAEPLGITNCLNFGNPYDSRVYWQFVQAVLGLRDACQYWNLPVTGGNVSFYNQTEKGPIEPLPVIGMVGLLDSLSSLKTVAFRQPGDVIYLAGPITSSLGSSQYLIHWHGRKFSSPPYFSPEMETRLHQFLRKVRKIPGIHSLHDVSEGGLWIALLESALAGHHGFSIQIPEGVRPDAFLFGEGQSRVVLSVDENVTARVEGLAESLNLPIQKVGVVESEPRISVQGMDWGPLSYWESLYEKGLQKYLDLS